MIVVNNNIKKEIKKGINFSDLHIDTEIIFDGDFSNCSFVGFNTNLPIILLEYSNFSGCNFSNCNLTNYNFFQMLNFKDANFTGATMPPNINTKNDLINIVTINGLEDVNLYFNGNTIWIDGTPILEP